MKHFGDITKINGAEVPTVDIITGGSPCQDLSVAGKRAGLAGERSGLFMEQMRIVKEMRELDRANGRTGWMVRPRYMVWENVPGAFSSGNPKGADFAAVIEEIIKVAEPGTSVSVCVPNGGWTKSGCYYAEDGSWSVAWRLHDAQFWGASQYVDGRVWIPGTPQRRKRIALVADFGGLSAPEILFERKGLSGDSEQSGEAGKETAGAAGEGVEGAIFYDAYQHHGWRRSETSGTLTVGQKNTVRGDTPLVFENHSQDSRYKPLGEVSETVSAKYGTGGNNQPLVVSDAVCVGNGQLNQMSMAEQANTLDTMHDQQAVLVFDKETYNCGKSCTGSPQIRVDNVAPTCRADDHPSGVAYGSVVRRLTPTECERLQGYPDGWTNIGEWVDSKGKKHKDADSPRYKALGNSIALPFWQWLAKRISAQYERTPTMASLFDGIGGFPLVFARAGTIPVWASEIEEFPIAVTKIRFPEEEQL